MSNTPRLSSRTRLPIALIASLFASVLFLHQMYSPRRVQAVSTSIVISQIYGGGGNTGATFTHDYIELFNRSNVPVSIAGWSLQYASATGTGNFAANSGQITELPAAIINPGQYFLVREASNAAVGAPLPTPDYTGDATPIAMAAGAGKVALVNTTTGLACNGSSTPCSAAALATIVDLVGYGNANFFEGAAPAPTISATLADFRDDLGCTDTDNNTADFSSAGSPATPAPRNTSTAANVCGGRNLSIGDVSQVETDGGTTNFVFNVSLTAAAGVGGVTFTINTADGTTNPANAGSDYVAIVNGSGSISEGGTSTTVTVTVNGDTSVEPNETFFVNITNITGADPGDTQGLGTITNDDVVVIPINQIQGSGTSSTLVGQSVTTRGIVTGLRSNGFFLQTPDGTDDGNSETSEGILVFTGGAPSAAAAIGNFVQVSGTVTEFIPGADPNSQPETELTSPTVSFLSPGTLPVPVVLTPSETTSASEIPGEPLDTLEEYEGMRVSVASLTVIAPTSGSINEPNATSSSNGVFYGVVTGVARPFREAGINVSDPVPAPNPANVPRFDENPERLRVDSDVQPGSSAINVTTGTVVSNITGPLDYGFRTYTILPDAATPPVVGVNAVATPAPVPTSTEFTVASFNTFHFYDTTNDPGSDGPLTLTAYNNRLNKISLVIRNVMRTPDVIGLQEIENLDVLQDIANKVNADAVAAGDSDPQYTAYLEEGHDIGLIDVGFLVKSSRVSVVDVTQIEVPGCNPAPPTTCYSYTDPNTGQPALLNDRPPLVLRATIQAPSGFTVPFTVIVNHLRSLNGVDDPVDGNRVRTKRRAGAEFLANLIQSRQSSNPSERIIVVGDMNAFQVNDGYVDVIGTIKGTPAPADQVVLPSNDLVNPDLTNLVDNLLPADQRYSYTFDGNAQVLDHIILNQPALALNTRFAYARNNADFPTIYYGDSTRPERITDHDIPVAYFTFPPDQDNDGDPDDADNCPTTANPGQEDADNDGVGDVCDNCSAISNPDQANFDNDTLGDACDPDDDNDGQSDADEIACGSNPQDASSKSLDTDGDNSPDCVDADDDNDDILDGADNCQFTPNPGQEDFDLDGIGDACDTATGPPSNKDQCKDGSWQRFDSPTFSNQGQCVNYVNHLP